MTLQVLFLLHVLHVLEGEVKVHYLHTVKFLKEAPPCKSPSKYKPPKPVTQKTLH